MLFAASKFEPSSVLLAALSEGLYPSTSVRKSPTNLQTKDPVQEMKVHF